MFFRKPGILILLLLIISTSFSIAQSQTEKNMESLQRGIQLVKKYFFEDKNWIVTTSSMENDVEGLIHFIEDEPIDSILNSLDKSVVRIQNYVYRSPDNVADSLSVPGYYPFESVRNDLVKIENEVRNRFINTETEVPAYLVADIENKVKTIEPGRGIELFTDSVFIMPDSLNIPEVIPDSLMLNQEDFNRLLQTDSLRKQYIENRRIEYNEMLIENYRDSVVQDYLNSMIEGEISDRTTQFADSVKQNNEQILEQYNQQVIKNVNDSIQFILLTMAAYADYIDSTQISITNLKGEKSDILLQQGNGQFARVWLKNEQNDSLSVLVKSIDKRTVQVLIDDGVTISRFKPTENREIDFGNLNKMMSGIDNLGNLYDAHIPWIFDGDGTVGFTQTYLENWKKGGESALSLLMVLKASANYTSQDNKIKWENSGEIRNGWIRPGDANSELQKNDDKFEVTSRFGVSAFKRWYYGAELNYNTQFFRGYKYPTSSNPEPFSAFMAPARTFFKIGLDYKPNENFSLFLSPLTAKNVYIRDTVLIDQTKYGVAANKKSFWEPGLNADLKWKKAITPDITFETKYKMFINYKHPFKKFDINWENLLVMRLTDYINMRMMLHLIYDDDVLFPVFDENDVQTGEKPRLQIKELITVGFSYTINRKVVTTRRVK